jgi:predicted alpha/beta-hydrolase family hydrolase
VGAPAILLAPGATGTVAGLRAHLAGLKARGLTARGVELPKGQAERAVPTYRAALDALGIRRPIIGGHSYGGRVASLLAATRDADISGLVLLSYPLHAPGRQEAWDERTSHWPSIGCPVLLLSGEADQFAKIDLLRQAVGRLKRAELVTYPGVRHGIGPVLDDALDRIATWASSLD